ncbi:MAG TPA: hypothetical protein VLI04_18290 [Nocardioidaceae bacterium]|nr:hypothetical protein [Nocardioidaceae bacterium]
MAGLVLACAAAAGFVALTNGEEEAKLPGGGRTAVQAAREERLVSLLDQLTDALGHGSHEDLAAPAGADQLDDIDGNVRRIGFSRLALRYVAPAEQSGQLLMPEDTWVADVQVTWQFKKYDPAESVLEIPFVVVDGGEEALFGGISASKADQRVPLWLTEGLAVKKGARTLVLAGDPDRLTTLARLAARAVPAVDAVLPDWDGRLVLAEPATSADLNRAVGSDASATAQLAGVTTTVDGTVVPGGTSHVLLNPDVFDRLGPRAAQIVVSHEATHVATDGAVSAAPQWLVEGFADYVALRDSDLSVGVSAGQALAEVRKNGPPAKLPAPADFSGQNANLGAMYESAWLACRLIAEEYGEQALVAFYRQADAVGDAGAAFRKVLGTSEAAFTRAWRTYLTDLASSS